jgi:ATP-dependent DNA ligase
MGRLSLPVFRDGDDVELQSKSGKPLGRYFPEVVEAVLALKAERFVLDGELIIPLGGVLSFDALQMRLHPPKAASASFRGRRRRS